MTNNFTPYERWEYTILPYTYREHVLPGELILDYDLYTLYLRNKEDTYNIQLVFLEYENHVKLTGNPHKVTKKQIGLENIEKDKKQLTLEEFKNHLSEYNPHKLNNTLLKIEKLKNFSPSTIEDVDNKSDSTYMTAEALKYYLDEYKFKLKNYRNIIIDSIPINADIKIMIDGRWEYGSYHRGMINTDYDFIVEHPDYYTYYGTINISQDHTETVILKEFANTVNLDRSSYMTISNNNLAIAVGRQNTIEVWGEENILYKNSPPGTNFKQVYSNDNLAVAITKTNSLFMWGDLLSPIMTNFTKEKITAKKIALNNNNIAIIQLDSSMKIYGNYNTKVYEEKTDLGKYKDVSMGIDHCVAIKEDGSLFSWGSNDKNQLNNVPGGNNFVQVSCGDYHTIALKNDGSIVGWGDNNFNQLNNIPTSTGNIYISANGNKAIYIKEDGSIGVMDKGLLNDNKPEDKSYYQCIIKNNICMALSYDGLIAVWGVNKSDTLIKTAPTQRNFKII